MYQFGNEKLDGVPVATEKGTLIVPALNLRQIKALTPDIKKMDGMAPTPAALEANADKIFAIKVKVIREGLGRNYPEITKEDVEDLLDLNNVEGVMLAILGQRKGEVVPAPGKIAAPAAGEQSP